MSDSEYSDRSSSENSSSSEDEQSQESDSDLSEDERFSSSDERFLQNEQNEQNEQKQKEEKAAVSEQKENIKRFNNKQLMEQLMEQLIHIRDARERQIRMDAIIKVQKLNQSQQQILKKIADEQQFQEQQFQEQMAHYASLEKKNAKLEQEKEELRKKIGEEEEQYKARVKAFEVKLLNDINNEHENLKNNIDAARADAAQQEGEVVSTFEDERKTQVTTDAAELKRLEQNAQSVVAQAKEDIDTQKYSTNAKILFENMKKGDFSGRFLRGGAPVEKLFQAFKTEMELAWKAHQDSLIDWKKQLDINVLAQNKLFENIRDEKNNEIIRLDNQIKDALEKKVGLEREKKELEGEKTSLLQKNTAATSQIRILDQLIAEEEAKIKDLQAYKDKLVELEEARKDIVAKYQRLREEENTAHANNLADIKENYKDTMEKANKLLTKELKKSNRLRWELAQIVQKLEVLRALLKTLEARLKKKEKERESIFEELDNHEKERPETRDLITVPKVFHSCVEDGLKRYTYKVNFILWEESIGDMAIKAAVTFLVPGCAPKVLTEGKKNPLIRKLITDDVLGNVDAYHKIPEYIKNPEVRKEFLAKLVDIVGGTSAKDGISKGAGSLAGSAAGWMAGSASPSGMRVFNSFLASALVSKIAEKGTSMALNTLGSAVGGSCYVIQQILIALMSKEECSIEHHQAYFYNRDATTKTRRIEPGWKLGGNLDKDAQISDSGISIDQHTFTDDMLLMFGTGSTSSKASPEKVAAWLNNRRRLRFVRDKDRSVYDYMMSEYVGFWVSSGFKDCSKSDGVWETGKCYANNIINTATAGAEATRNLGYWIKGNASEVVSMGGGIMDKFLGLFGIDTKVQSFFENSAPLCPEGCISGKSSLGGGGDAARRATNNGIDYGLWLRDLNVLFWFWHEDNEQYDGAGAVLYIDIEPPGKMYCPFYISGELYKDTPGQMKTSFPQPESRNERLVIDEMTNKKSADINMTDVKTLRIDDKTGALLSSAAGKYTKMQSILEKREYVDQDWTRLPNYMQRMYRKMQSTGFQKNYDKGPLYEQDIMLQQLAGFLEKWRKKEKKLIVKLNAVEAEIASIKEKIAETTREIMTCKRKMKRIENKIKKNDATINARIARDETAAKEVQKNKLADETKRNSNSSREISENEVEEQQENSEDTDDTNNALKDAEVFNQGIEAFVKEKNAKIAVINDNIIKRKKRILDIDTRLADIERNKADIDAEISTKNAKIVALNSQIEAARQETQQSIEQLKSELEAQQEEEKGNYETIAVNDWENYDKKEKTTIEEFKAELWDKKKQELDDKHEVDKQKLLAKHADKITSMKADLAANKMQISVTLTEELRTLEEEHADAVAIRQDEHEQLVKEHTKEKELQKDKLEKQLDHVSELYETEQRRIVEQKRQIDLEKKYKMDKLKKWYNKQQQEIKNSADHAAINMNLQLKNCQDKYNEDKEEIENNPEDSQLKLEELEEQQRKIKQDIDALSGDSSDASSEASDISNEDTI